MTGAQALRSARSGGLYARSISKRYDKTRALSEVSFAVEYGQVVALMGRNGAGKSTLVRILSGAERPDTGSLSLGGEDASFSKPDDALDAGIATVHQEVAIIGGLTVTENVLLGKWRARGGVIRTSENRRIASEALAILDVDVDLDRPAGDLTTAEQQLVEIARALANDPKILILDEPTSSLSDWEAARLGQVVRRLAARGVGVIYVSHRMGEISKVADVVSVIRDGRIVASIPVAEASVRDIAHLMAGEELLQAEERALRDQSTSRTDDVVLSARDLSTSRVHDVTLSVRRGEVIGLAGRLGAGRSEILRALAGVDRRTGGTLVGPDARVIPPNASVRRFLARGIAFVPEDRRADGLILPMPIKDNLVMSSFGRVSTGGIVSSRRVDELAGASRDAMSIRVGSLNDDVSTLSGGNQQKVVIGRCLNSQPSVVLLDEPTRGVDIQAKIQIFEIVASLARSGIAVVFASSEYEELLEHCDRILLIDEQTVVRELPGSLTLDDLLAYVMHGEDETEKTER